MFDGGIFGSPDTKEHILSREGASGNVSKPALFLGDSKYDYHAATQAGLDFIFVSMWTEVEDWPTFTQKAGIRTINGIAELIDLV
jgi:phosphoglycolate phosphatase-like HAD superfamily hydrolase